MVLHNPQLNANASYFVFLTFVEIYSNCIYHLLDDDILNQAPQTKQMREDNRGRPYIRDMAEVIELLNMGL
ncbi:unnamed protein product [Adineta ricciae]|uniref:Kinesin motor domain-containing protein n=1 Tax=Adineta ricciae TaxID=249248 RepID=A0A815R5C3_ADIRI|nr:unnamed protein product [Adineta ricciae]